MKQNRSKFKMAASLALAVALLAPAMLPTSAHAETVPTASVTAPIIVQPAPMPNPIPVPIVISKFVMQTSAPQPFNNFAPVIPYKDAGGFSGFLQKAGSVREVPGGRPEFRSFSTTRTMSFVSYGSPTIHPNYLPPMMYFSQDGFSGMLQRTNLKIVSSNMISKDRYLVTMVATYSGVLNKPGKMFVQDYAGQVMKSIPSFPRQ